MGLGAVAVQVGRGPDTVFQWIDRKAAVKELRRREAAAAPPLQSVKSVDATGISGAPACPHILFL